MKQFRILMAAAAVLAAGSVQAQSLQELAAEVRQAAREEAQINQEREARFLAERNNQQQLLAQARQELAAAERRSDQLKAQYDEFERQLAELETTLAERLGNLGELFGVVRQSAGDIAAALDDSMVTAQYPNRSEFLSQLAQRKELPTVPELRQMWSAVVTEISEQGQVVEFPATVERADGEKEDMNVMRVGVFVATSDGLFLDWDTSKSTERFIELARQPADRFQEMAEDLQSAAPGETSEMAVDFTRGQILRAVVQSKTPIERVKDEGGIVGYVILGVGLLGLLLCAWKAFQLYSTGAKMKSQLKSDTPKENNPLGRVMAVYTKNPDADIETLEL